MTSAAQEEFVAKVYPELNKSCTTCHATGSLGAPRFLSGASPADVYYNVHYYRDGALIQPPSINLFLNKGKHEGPDILGTQRNALEHWLDTENPNFDDNTKPQNFYDTLANFASCLNFDQFKAQQLDQIFKLPVRADPKVTCQTCHDVNHVEQSADLLLNNKAADVFNDFVEDVQSELKLVSAVVSSTGSFQGLQPSDRLRLKGTEFNNCSPQVALDLNFNVTDPKYCHPDYDFPLTNQVRDFVSNTLLQSKNGLCQNQKP